MKFVVTYYANLSRTFPKIATNSPTMSLIAGRYSQNLDGAEFAWTTDTELWSDRLVLPKQGSYNQNEILFGVQMVNS